MRNGTQEDLDLAKKNALLIPINVKFKTKKNALSAYGLPDGEICYRTGEGWQDDAHCVAVMMPDGEPYYVDANDLEPIND